MTDQSPRPSEGGDIFSDPVFLRNLKIAVVVMALILILGFIAIIARIFYLSSASRTPSRDAATAASAGRLPAATETTLAAKVRLALPPGAAVRSTSLAASRIAVHYEAPGGGGIVILDLESGRTLSRIEFAAEPQR
jgi:hypothetical protein